MRFTIFVLATAAAISAAQAQDYNEPAYYEDIVLSRGFRPDPRTVELQSGGENDADELGGDCIGMVATAPDVQLEFESDGGPLDFSVESDGDTSLVINDPSGDWVCDDDSGEGLNPLVQLENAESGTYDIWVGSVDSDENFDATLNISGRNTGTGNAVAGIQAPAAGGRVERGGLAAGDQRRANGEYQDGYTFDARAGEQFVIDLRSEDFDTYLIVRAPNGEEFTNDDFESSLSRSLLTLNAPAAGRYQVFVSSYEADETGAYTLNIGGQMAAAQNIQTDQTGALANGDETRPSGEYIDTYQFAGTPGRRVTIDLTSDDFDTYLILVSPSGTLVENDDTDTTNSRIETMLSESGNYRVRATSYESGETGDYRVRIQQSNPFTVAEQSSRDTIALTLGQAANGRLQQGDAERDTDRFQDTYSFNGTAGQNVRIEMTSNGFDSFLSLNTPNGQTIENDDFEGSTARSAIELTLQQTGRYQVLATSYGAGETGDYQLMASISNAAAAPIAPAAGRGGNVYGIFAGISDYSRLREITREGWGDLDFTADDALVTRDALLQSAGMPAQNAITLTDGQATLANIRQAFRDISARIGPNDVFVFFFSGHGGQRDRAGGPNAADADAVDEFISVYDGKILDDEMDELFSQIGASASVIILDSCFSGGFAKDVVSRPGRMGLFSSDEDVPSLVAAKFRAGGYLSFFFKDAVDEGHADEDGDDAINAMELSQYIHERYSEEAVSKAASTFDTPHFGYQHLVADRGGVRHDAVLFHIQ